MVATDWVLLAVLLLSVALGLWRGLMYEVLSVAGWVAAFVLAQAFAADVGQWLPTDGLSPAVRLVVGFVLIFVVVAFPGGSSPGRFRSWWPRWACGRWTACWVGLLAWRVAW